MWSSQKAGKPCKYCGKPGHTVFNCPRKPRKPLVAKSRMRRVGKIGRKLLDQRTQWFKDNPRPYYECIYCLIVGLPTCLTKEEANLEHGMSKVRHPELRFVQDNLYISCPSHNQDKGSMNIDEYIEKLIKEMQDGRN